jgi:tetraprenyl-beta-curcumene synthase
MIDFINCIYFAKKHSKIVYPIVTKKILEYSKYISKIRSRSIRAYAIEALEKNKFDLAVSSIFTLYPHVDIPLATEVIFSFQAIIQYLDTICSHSSESTEPFLKLIFSSLKDATNIRSDDFIKYFTFFPSKDDDGYLSILVEKCRQKVLLLPSFNIVRDYIVAYLSLFIDLQVTKYSSDQYNRELNLHSWSNAHAQKYTDISNWEFCMSIDSPLTLQMLLSMATNPDLTEHELESISNSFFPWICGIQKILEGYLNYNDTLFSRSINHIFYYTNLKEFEDRIIYFIEKASENKTSNFRAYRCIIKIILIIYVTHPKAIVGMNRITSKVLLRAGGRGMFIYTNIIKPIKDD